MTSNEDNEPILRTTPKRLGQGIAILVGVMAIGAAFLIPFFNDMYKVPPPVTKLASAKPAGEKPAAEPGTTVITILSGAVSKGNPDYDPDDAKVPLNNKVIWANSDLAPHTATSGNGATDPAAGKVFNTQIIDAGSKSTPVDLKGLKEGQVVKYFCEIHPYMTSQLTIAPAGAAQSSGGAATAGGGQGKPSASAGPTITIPSGASSPGSTPYEPIPLSVKKGDKVTVVNSDSAPHTVTNGKGPEDPQTGKLFDTSMIEGGASATIDTAKLTPGDYDYHCSVHPFMKGVLKVS